MKNVTAKKLLEKMNKMAKARPKIEAFNRKNKFLKKGRELLNEKSTDNGKDSS